MSHARVPLTIRLDQFEGPLDLLLYLIQSHELEVSKVSISRITRQYLSYLKMMQDLNFEIAGEFLVMAATLMYWKSKAILPKEDEGDGQSDEDENPFMSQDELVRQLLEHQRFLAAGDDLSQLPRLYEDTFFRTNKRPPVERVWREMNVTDLALSFQETEIKARKRKKILRKETVSLAEKISQFKDQLTIGEVTALTDLMNEKNYRPETVVTFLSGLELARLKSLKLYQNETYDPIYVELIKSMVDFDVSLAKGFDEEEIAPAPEASP